MFILNSVLISILWIILEKKFVNEFQYFFSVDILMGISSLNCHVIIMYPAGLT